jgi:protocatechuate 3,4-dioxygenase beta subunit
MDAHERLVTRRELLRLGLAAAVVAVWTPRNLLWTWADDALVPTPPLTAGPFYPEPRPLERDFDLTRLAGHAKRARGEVVHVSGRVLNVRGEPVAGARVEVWQANSFGRYAHRWDRNPAPLDPDFQGYGEQRTDREGRFRFVTIKPGPYPGNGSGNVRTPHIHFDVTGRSARRTTQLFFPGEPLNAQDRLFQEVAAGSREALVARVAPAPSDADPAARSSTGTSCCLGGKSRSL